MIPDSYFKWVMVFAPFVIAGAMIWIVHFRPVSLVGIRLFSLVWVGVYAVVLACHLLAPSPEFRRRPLDDGLVPGLALLRWIGTQP